MFTRKRIVIALGGNALGNTLPEQMVAVKTTAKALCDLIEEGHQVVVVHGNGPQVGMINNAMSALSREDENQPNTPLSVCVAMSQAYIGYDLQNALREELRIRGFVRTPVVTVVTQVRVDPNDPAFENPSKPIGKFLTKEEADHQAKAYGHIMKEDAGRGYRRVVASPKPVEIVEQDAINSLVDANKIVICCGGGGIPVTLQGDHLKGASAVIDKDFASCLLAKELDADMLIILTAVEKVAVNFGKENEKWLDEMTVEEIRALKPDRIILSPGPGRPEDAGVIIAVAKELGKEIPILGVCLGHQAICAAYGATVIYAKELMHGKQSDASFDTESLLFKGCPKKAKVARYHSLAADADTMPDCLKITATTDDGEIMAVEHKEYPIYGVQFHPESIMTPDGKQMLSNFIKA